MNYVWVFRQWPKVLLHNIKASTSFAIRNLLNSFGVWRLYAGGAKSVYVFGREYALIEPNTLYLNKTSEEYEILPVWLHLQNYARILTRFILFSPLVRNGLITLR